MSWTRTIAVEFCHCDPAGIVFFPRYFEMANSVVENFFAAELGRPFAAVIAGGNGCPTARIGADFLRPSRLGDVLDFEIAITRIGRTSAAYRMTGRAGGEARLRIEGVLVWTGAGGRPEPWPDDLRAGLEKHLEGHPEGGGDG